jgi:predicted lipid-binding transport protein (Tim44 family)
MRAIFGILGLILVVAVVGMLAKKQLHSVSEIQPMPQDSNPSTLTVTAPGATVQQQSLQIQQQVKKSVEDSLQQTRAVPEDK